MTKCCVDCFKYEYHEFEDGDYIRICKCYDETKNLENNPHNEFKKWDCPYYSHDYFGTEKDLNNMINKLNEQDERIQDLLKYKYLVKALEEVSGSHYIEEIISDYSDGAVSDEKEQLELGKWHSEHGLSWEDGDVE